MTDDAPRSPLGLAFVGCFTTARRRARGRGIDIYRVGAGLEGWTHLGRVEELDNPSFLVTDPARSVLYTVQGDGAVATAFAVAPDGTLARPRQRGNRRHQQRPSGDRPERAVPDRRQLRQRLRGPDAPAPRWRAGAGRAGPADAG